MMRPMAATFLLGAALSAFAQQMTVVKPVESDAVLNNPGIGFTTFQRFNGDSLNHGVTWTEGVPIEYQAAKAVHDPGYPDTTIAYFRVYWRFLQPERDLYDWKMIDDALAAAHSHGQRLMLRVAPHGLSEAEDVPAWYRAETGEVFHKDGPKSSWIATKEKWLIDPENPAYAKEFGGFIRKLAERYDGHPDLELVDISILAAWGEGAGSELLTEPTRRGLLDSYLDSFYSTPLVTQLTDKATAAYTLSRARGDKGDKATPRIGWRADCLGDMGGFSPTVNLMTDTYPEAIANLGLGDLWQRAPVTMESCWVMQRWKDSGWDLKYIMDQAIKWHMSSFNNKSSAVPPEWWPQVNEWLNRMGYRFVLRRFAFSASVDRTRRLEFRSWWENKGNAPIYRPYAISLRLKSESRELILPLEMDVTKWLPGDTIANGAIFLPENLPDGIYALSLAIVDPATKQAAVKLAIQGIGSDGWFGLGTVKLAAASVR